jgi:YhcH/YjgK/YiaL family protein
MVVDCLENENHLLLQESVAYALSWLRNPDAAARAPGTYELRGRSLYAIVDEYMTRPQHACRLETHRRYVDIQYVVSGRELMGYAPAVFLDPDGAYDEGRDVQFHQGHADFLLLQEGMFAVMLPGDAHMPGVAIDGQAGPVKKIVIKAAVGLL